jgi:hypothetical protein
VIGFGAFTFSAMIARGSSYCRRICAAIGPGAVRKYGSLENVRGFASVGPVYRVLTLYSPSNRKCQPIASRSARKKNTRHDQRFCAVAMTSASSMPARPA